MGAPAAANPGVILGWVESSWLGGGFGVLQGRGFAKTRDHDIDQAVCPASEMLEDVSLAAAPVFLTHAHAQLAACSQLDATIDVYGRARVQKNVPGSGKAGPVLVEDAAELGAAVLGEQGIERGAVVEQEGGVGADELLDEQSGWADFTRRVLDSAVGVGAGTDTGTGGGG